MRDILALKNSLRKKGKIENWISWEDSALWIVRPECTYLKDLVEREEEFMSFTRKILDRSQMIGNTLFFITQMLDSRIEFT
jgi:hypothetical protein